MKQEKPKIVEKKKEGKKLNKHFQNSLTILMKIGILLRFQYNKFKKNFGIFC